MPKARRYRLLQRALPTDGLCTLDRRVTHQLLQPVRYLDLRVEDVDVRFLRLLLLRHQLAPAHHVLVRLHLLQFSWRRQRLEVVILAIIIVQNLVAPGGRAHLLYNYSLVRDTAVLLVKTPQILNVQLVRQLCLTLLRNRLI